MLHLFNSCYVYPDALFDPTAADYIVIGSRKDSLGTNLQDSFYYTNASLKQCWGKYNNVWEFYHTNLVTPIMSNKDKFYIYVDNDAFIQVYASYLKAQVKEITPQFFTNASRILSVRLKTRAKLLQPASAQMIRDLADTLSEVTSIPDVPRLISDDSFITENAGVEWKVSVGNYDGVSDLINRYVYSHFEEARANYLSRNPNNTWVADQRNYNYNTVVSMQELYMQMRKQLAFYTDDLIQRFYAGEDIATLLEDPKSLILLSGNKNISDKVDIWMLRWLMTMPEQEIKSLRILA